MNDYQCVSRFVYVTKRADVSPGSRQQPLSSVLENTQPNMVIKCDFPTGRKLPENNYFLVGSEPSDRLFFFNAWSKESV